MILFEANESTIKTRLPVVARARGFRVYTTQGRRFIDFYQDGGRAILGHRPEHVGLVMKNLLSKGLVADYPSIYVHRFTKALRTLFPEASEFRWYRNEERALAAACIQLGDDKFPPLVADPALTTSLGRVHLWRPFLEGSAFPGEVMIPVLPLPGRWGPVVLVLRTETRSGVPESDEIAPVILGAVVRIIYNLIAEIGSRDRTVWDSFCSGIWSRKGPYLVAGCTAEEYGPVFDSCLEQGILISPMYPGPSIIPAEYSKGEIKHFVVSADNSE
jgi:hypothetical protein